MNNQRNPESTSGSSNHVLGGFQVPWDIFGVSEIISPNDKGANCESSTIIPSVSHNTESLGQVNSISAGPRNIEEAWYGAAAIQTKWLACTQLTTKPEMKITLRERRWRYTRISAFRLVDHHFVPVYYIKSLFIESTNQIFPICCKLLWQTECLSG